MSDRPRVFIAVLVLSAVGFVGITNYEGFTSNAVQPVPGDKFTYGFGNTTKPDGSPVKPGDKITPPAAVAHAQRTVAVKESALKKCINAPLHQHEYDAFVSLAYNVGTGAVCNSSIPKKLSAGQYEAACKTILDFKRVQGRDCSLPENKSFCGGIWTRRQHEYRTCMGETP